MAITSEIIGKLGGGAGVEVEVAPVSAPYEFGSPILHSVSAPAGKQYLVAVTGTASTSATTTATYPKLQIGDTSARMPGKELEWACVAVVTQDTDVILDNSTATRTGFSGTVYIAEM